MKTKFYWVALLASAALIAQANAGGHHGGGGFGGVGRAGASGGGARASSFGPRSNFGGGRFMGPGARFSSYGAPIGFHQQRFGGSDRMLGRSGQFATGTANRRFDGSRTFSRGDNRFTRTGNNFGSRGLNGGREHLFARRSADWHRDWDRNRDHFWRGHRCRFVNGEWFIFDSGFDPYDYWYPYGYPYGYYPYDYYSDSYYPGGYDGVDGGYYDEGVYPSEQSTDSTITTAQEQLSREGYYQGAIDGTYGPETRRAIMRYQRDHGLHVTGRLNADTLEALGLRRVASK
ncbi:MAG TPA: peptidoglycan-binding domain-containing protein [Chthoniobacterales bacterium]